MQRLLIIIGIVLGSAASPLGAQALPKARKGIFRNLRRTLIRQIIRRNVRCRMTKQPVCGSDGKTYRNSCFAYSAGARSSRPGECGSRRVGDARRIGHTRLGLRGATCEVGKRYRRARGVCRCPQGFRADYRSSRGRSSFVCRRRAARHEVSESNRVCEEGKSFHLRKGKCRCPEGTAWKKRITGRSFRWFCAEA